MTGRRLYTITAAMMLSLFLASIEVTVVATAMPTIVAQLGGLSIYAWVFSAFALASTTAVPIFGKVSDIYGRRPIYLIAMAIFLVGSTLCGFARTMPQLVAFRAIQGLGAGGLMPLAITIIGDIFTFEQRARMQGVFSGVWGVSSVIGPLFGGFVVDHASWQWVFFVNIIPGLVAAALMIIAWRDVNPRTMARVDYIGAVLLSGGIIALLLALFQLNEPLGWSSANFRGLLILSLALLGALLWVERRVPDPILPIALFRERLFATAIGHGLFSGFALFGSIAFIPFFVQTVLGTNATTAGATLTPQLIAWVAASIIGSRLLLRFGYRSIALTGMTLFVVGSILMTQIGPSTPQWVMAINVSLTGIGMGLSIPPFLIAVQSTVPRQSLGTATSSVQFSRNIGGTIGVSVMGVILTLRLGGALTQTGIDPQTVSLGSLLDAGASASIAATLAPIRGSLAIAFQGVFIAALLGAICGWLVTALAPRGRIQRSTETQTASAGAAAAK